MKISKIFLCLAILGFLAVAASALAATGDYVPLVQIPGVVNTGNFLQYLSGIYNFLISIVGILAMASLVYGGFRYLTSVGNPAAVEDAKDIINSAIIGLVLALSSWLILNEINPDVLVTSRKPGITGQTWPGYKYNQPPSTRDCVVDTNLDGVSVQGDSTKKKCKCVDDPTRDVTFTPSTVTGPFVTSTTPAPCGSGVPTTLPYAIVINYSEPMDPGTIMTPGSITVIPSISSTPSMLPGNTGVKLDLTAPIDDTFNTYTVTVHGGAYNKSAKGVPMASDYDFKFTPNASFAGCTPPTQIVVDCIGACSNPATPGLNPSGYHCAVADLKAGTSPSSMNIDDTVNIKAGDTVYFDAKTYSRNFAAPNFNVDVSPSTDSKFHNGVDSYIMKTQLTGGPPWDSASEKLQLGMYDYFYTVPSSGCSTLASWATGFFNTVVSAFGGPSTPGAYTEGMLAVKYNNKGEYKAILNIYVLDSNGVCRGIGTDGSLYVDSVYIKVSP